MIELEKWYKMQISSGGVITTVFFKPSSIDSFNLVYARERITSRRHHKTSESVLIGKLNDENKLVPSQKYSNIYKYLTDPVAVSPEEIKRKLMYIKYGL